MRVANTIKPGNTVRIECFVAGNTVRLECFVVDNSWCLRVVVAVVKTVTVQLAR